jgi:hypothetical protein
MTLRIFAGDFKSGSADPHGFRLRPCDSTGNLAEFIPHSNVQTLERFDNIGDAMRRDECGASTAAISGFDALTKLITDDTRVPFIVRFKDGRRMIGSVGAEAWNQLVPKVSRSFVISESYDSYKRFDQIDWIAATPNWSSIVVGGILPALAIIALAFTIDAVLCLAFEQWIGHFWTIPIWLVAAITFPLALIGTVIFANELSSSSG